MNKDDDLKKQGLELIASGRLNDAKALFTRLSQTFPQDVQIWNALSTVYGKLGDIEEAGNCCRKALAIQPENGEAHVNLGHVFFHSRKFDEAISQYQKSLELDPGNVAALNNMGMSCQTGEHYAKYVEYYRKTIALIENPSAVRNTFSDVIKGAIPASYDSWLDGELQKCYGTEGCDYQSLCSLSARLLKLKFGIKSPISGDAQSGLIGQIASDGLLLMMLEKTVLADADLEILLTDARRALLLKYCRQNSLDAGEFRLALALAYQGFNNEYVFCVDAEEEGFVADVRRIIEKLAPSMDTPNEDLESRLYIFGMYDRFSSLSCRKHLAGLPLSAWSEQFRPLLTEALINPLEEEAIKEILPSLGGGTDQTSELVQSQYEENPYPRWISIGKKRQRSLRTVLQLFFPFFVPPDFVDGPIQILVAGCGTGQHPIELALRYQHAEILAVDLCKSSLAYASRMAQKLGVTNVNFMQGDILNLGMLNRRFHMVECVGVLHHMQDPLAGWKVLTNLLAEDGLMSIGLYSELARKHIIAAREIIKNGAFSSGIDSIRKFRAQILTRRYNDSLHALLSSRDFYSTSGCRDLLFHYQEHRYTLQQLRNELEILHLDFIGFMFEDLGVGELYRSHFPDDQEMRNLLLWERFEHMYPNTFSNMYKFWCQKKSADSH